MDFLPDEGGIHFERKKEVDVRRRDEGDISVESEPSGAGHALLNGLDLEGASQPHEGTFSGVCVQPVLKSSLCRV